jgi:NTP pyrophosphatase (non-canonical NTP hydrolase)
MVDTTLTQLQAQVLDFVSQRDWQKHHTIDNIARYLVIEASELAELFVWVDGEQETQSRINEVVTPLSHELADVLYCLAEVANVLGVSLFDIVLEITQSKGEVVQEPSIEELQFALAGEYLRKHPTPTIKHVIDQLLVGSADLLVNVLSGAYKNDKDEIVPEAKDLIFKLLFLNLIIAECSKIHVAAAFMEKLLLNAEKYPVEKAKGNFRKYNEL